MISISYWIWLHLFSTAPAFLGLLILTVPLTILLSELLYRGVERPGIAIGARLAHESMQVAVSFERKAL